MSFAPVEVELQFEAAIPFGKLGGKGDGDSLPAAAASSAAGGRDGVPDSRDEGKSSFSCLLRRQISQSNLSPPHCYYHPSASEEKPNYC